MKKFIIVIAATFLFFNIGKCQASEEKASSKECEKKCTEAASIIKKFGIKTAFEIIEDKEGPFVWKDSFIYIIDSEKGIVLTHPYIQKMKGQLLSEISDVNGKKIFMKFMEVGKNNRSGWVDYVWLKPGEKRPSIKKTFVFKIPEHDFLILASIYED